MCFYRGDSDWYAEVSDDVEGPAPQATRCDECWQRINKGEWRREVVLREHELCQVCEASDDDGEGIAPCDDGEHQYGETFDYDCCERCQCLRDAIKAVEEADGCTGSETQPRMAGMHDDIGNGEGWGHYTDRFLALGLTRAFALAPCPEPDEVFEALCAEYPGSFDDYQEEPVEWVYGGES